MKIIKECEFCKKEFESYKKKNRRFCSLSCNAKWQYQNGSKLGFQKDHKFYKGGEKGWFTTERVGGEKNVNWIDGRKRCKGYPTEFKKLKKRLMNMINTCSVCFEQIKEQTPNKHLVVHHKDEDIHNNQLNNLQVLCNSCHRKVHRKVSSNVKETKNSYLE